MGMVTLVQGVQKFLPRVEVRDIWALPRVFIFCVIVLYCYDHIGYVHSQMQDPDSSPWVSEYRESKQLLEWAQKHLPPDAIIAANNPAYVFLHTGRRAISGESPLESREIWQRIGVQYYAALESYALTGLNEEGKFSVLYRTPTDMCVIDLSAIARRTEPKP